MTTTDELTDRARFLRNAAPQAYFDFCTAFANYTGQKFDVLTEVAPDRLHQSIGHAQQCKKILQILEGAKNG